MMRKLAAIIIGLSVGLCAAQAMARNGQYLFREMARYEVPSGAAPALTASLLLHFDEASGSTNIVDSGKHGLTISSVSSASTTNDPVKFGNSGQFIATSRHFATQWTNDFRPGTNNWSVDFWVQLSAVSVTSSTTRWIFGDASINLRNFLTFQRTSAFDWRFDMSTNGTAARSVLMAYGREAASNKWQHIALWRLGNKLYGATNGVVLSLTFSDMTGYDIAPTNTRPMLIGGTSGQNNGGYLDEFRYCVGSAMKYTTNNFTPPTVPYTGYE